MAKKQKYKNYAELAAAFKAGELQHYYILIDKGGSDCTLRYHNPALDDGENDEKSDGCRALFDGDLHEAPEALFDALGIPHQPA